MRRVAGFLFAESWAFFLPYLGVYLAALGLDLTNGVVRDLFLGLHVVILFLFFVFVADRLHRRYTSFRALATDPGFWFWTLLVAGFLLYGAYLEFPGDPWEHLRRLSQPRADEPLRRGPWVEKFAYFWGWSLLSLLDRAFVRSALDAYSAFWQSLLALQFYRLSRRLGFSARWSWIQIFGIVATFGNNIISFLRYYALSSSALAYVAYLQAAIVVLDLVDGRVRTRWRPALVLLATVTIMRMNHRQEMLLFLVFVGTVVSVRAFERLTSRARTAALWTLAGAYALSLVVGHTLMASPRVFGLHAVSLAELWPWMSRFGFFRIYDPNLTFWHTMGVHGLCATILALCCWRLNRRVASLTVVPLLLLVTPPVAIALTEQFHPRNSYRVLFAFPDSFMLVAACESLFRTVPSLARLRRSESQAQITAVVVLLGFGLWGSAPGWGKLHFQYHRPSEALSARFIDATVQWFDQHPPADAQCVVKSDTVSEFTLASFTGGRYTVDRVTGQHVIFGKLVDWRVGGPEDLASYLGYQRLCGFLVVDQTVLDKMRGRCERSWVGEVSSHWSPYAACLPARVPPQMPADVASLIRLGWRKVPVPPFYWYYEPPKPR